MKKAHAILPDWRFYPLISILIVVSLFLTSLPPVIPRAVAQIDQPAIMPTESSSGNPGQPVERQPSESPDRPHPKPKKVTVSVSPDRDVELESPSKKTKLKIPRGAVNKEVEIELIEHTPWPSTGMRMVSLFELNAYKTGKGRRRLTSF